MDEPLEFEGRTVEDALRRASEALNREAGTIAYEVVEETRRGFLGLGGRAVKIRVFMKTRIESPPGADGERDEGPAGTPSSGGPGAGGQAVRRPFGRPPDRGRITVGGPDRDPGRSERGGRRGASRPAGERVGRPITERVGAPPAASKEVAYSRHDALRSVAGRILRGMNLELRARLRDREGSVILELSGTDSPLLLERDGEALEALQHVLNKIMARDERFGARVVVDCEGFRSQHDEQLLERAKHAAEQAVETGKAVFLDGMNPYERRLVHLALAENKNVRTFSTGEDPSKRLTIEPIAGAVRAEEA